MMLKLMIRFGDLWLLGLLVLGLMASCQAHADAAPIVGYELAIGIYTSVDGHGPGLHNYRIILRVPYPTKTACDDAVAYSDNTFVSTPRPSDLSPYLVDYFCLPIYKAKP